MSLKLFFWGKKLQNVLFKLQKATEAAPFYLPYLYMEVFHI